MPSADITLYIRNRYTVTIKSEYGTVLNRVQTIYQGEKIVLTAQADYFYDVSENGALSKRYCYTFGGYFAGESKLASLEFTMPNADTEIVANWTEQIKNYYTISFNTKTTGLSNTADKGVTEYPSVIVLEGETFDLSGYKPTCVYKWVIWYHCNFKGWKVNGNIVTSFVVSGNTTVEAEWSTPQGGRG